MANPSSCLSHDLVVEILLRSLVKSLLRFKCVCKSWLALISDPQFAKSQFDLAAAVTHRVLLKPDVSVSEIQSVDVEASLYDDSAVVNLRLPPRPVRGPKFQIFGYCRGFVFLAHEVFRDITVWNPSTGAHMQIPIYPSGLWNCFLHGFSLKTNVFSIVPDVDFLGFYCTIGHDFKPGVLFNESLHWWLYTPLTHGFVVVAFDLIHRSVFEIPLLPDLAMSLATPRPYHLNIMDGYPCLCYQGICGMDEVFEIWIMKEYKVASSWTKSFVLPFTSIAYSQFLSSCYTRCGDIFGSSGYGGELMKLNFNDDKAHIVEYRSCLPFQGFVQHFHFYRESLLPLPLHCNFDEAKYKERYNPKKRNKKVNKKNF
ncbi:F-box/kelch-repeat protein At3g06240-like [Lotus japonicus]|uniref:F-box/kelch-repeat protein At3g06240-like n=1 Tax=Lotus japonicus TaxID=34305 RepID=UPI002588AE5F|nr:F-box/kelch-repeat protein At3g06240-like [Lotus japonicus]